MLIHQRQWSFKNNCWGRRKFCNGRAVVFIMMVKFEGVFLSICFFCLDFYGFCLFQKEVVCDFKSLPRENYFRFSSNPLYFFILHPILCWENESWFCNTLQFSKISVKIWLWIDLHCFERHMFKTRVITNILVPYTEVQII